MSSDETELVERLRAVAETFEMPSTPTADDVRRGRRRVRRRHVLVAGAAAAAVVVVLIATAAVQGQNRAGSDKQDLVKRPEVVRAASNGWVAIDTYRDHRLGPSGGSDIYLVRPHVHARRLDVPGSDAADDACPAWSPDGTRLMFGRLTDTSSSPSRGAELVIVPVSPDGATGTPEVIALDGFEALDGFDPFPCATWAPDGRWVALRGPGAVWVVDTRTRTVRRLPQLRPTDLEWRPGTDQLAIAGDIGSSRASDWTPTPVMVYSVSTGDLHRLGSVTTTAFAWAPDGSALAFEKSQDGRASLELVNADGSDERLLVPDLRLGGHGIGPAWSPTGDRIAYQRQHGFSLEGTEVALVTVFSGAQRIIEPPKTGAGGPGEAVWYPYDVSWAPDGTTLLYTVFSSNGVTGDAVISVPADAPGHPTVLTHLPPVTSHSLEPWVPLQVWGRSPR